MKMILGVGNRTELSTMGGQSRATPGNKCLSEGVAATRGRPEPDDQPAAYRAKLPANSQFRADLMRQGPLAGRYPAVAAMVTLALIPPYLALSAALDRWCRSSPQICT